MEKLDTLNIARKVCTNLEFDFSDYIFPSGSRIVWTVKDSPNGTEKFIRIFNEQKIYMETISIEEANSLTLNSYYYDLVMELSNGESYKVCLTSLVTVEDTIYGTKD